LQAFLTVVEPAFPPHALGASRLRHDVSEAEQLRASPVACSTLYQPVTEAAGAVWNSILVRSKSAAKAKGADLRAQGEIAFFCYALKILRATLDTVLELAVFRRQKPKNLVCARRGGHAQAGGRKIDRLANGEFVAWHSNLHW
jgi:hypothetical protein